MARVSVCPSKVYLHCFFNCVFTFLLADPGEIIEGKREKKTVQRLNMQMGKPKEKLKVESIGHGDKLGDIARVNHAIGKLKAPQLKPLHKILYDRPGAVSFLH